MLLRDLCIRQNRGAKKLIEPLTSPLSYKKGGWDNFLEREKNMEKSFVLQLLNERFEDIQLSYCGYAECEPLHTFGPATRPHYLVHFILDGQGNYQIGGKNYRLHKNQGFLIPANQLTTYQADEQEPWTYIWIGIRGRKSVQ